MPLAYLINYTGLAAILVCGVCLFAAAQGEASQAVRSSASSAVNSSVPDLALDVYKRQPHSIEPLPDSGRVRTRRHGSRL